MVSYRLLCMPGRIFRDRKGTLKPRLSLSVSFHASYDLQSVLHRAARGKDRPDHPDPPPVLAASGQSRARLCLYHALYSPHEKWAQLLLSIVFAVFVATVGSSVRPYLHMPQNIYKTSDEILEISSIIESDSAATGLEKRTLYSSQQLLELRQYDPSIRGILRRNDLLDWSIDPDDETQIADVIASNHHLHRLALVSRYGIQIDRQEFLTSAKKCTVNYIISHSDMGLADYYEAAGYEKLGQAGEFEIFRIRQTDTVQP